MPTGRSASRWPEARNRLYFTSDDGYLYCLAADTGALRWKFRGGPADRKILGNKRLISTWPARGGVVLYGDAVYFAASIWPFMGTFIYALDAETGSVIWRNEGTGADYQNQPHNSPAFAGVAPQGAMVALADRLLIPGGRSVPACFDRRTGKLLYYHLAVNNKTGGAFVAADERRFFNHYRDRETDLYDVAKRQGRGAQGRQVPGPGRGRLLHVRRLDRHPRCAGTREAAIHVEGGCDGRPDPGRVAALRGRRRADRRRGPGVESRTETRS